MLETRDREEILVTKESLVIRATKDQKEQAHETQASKKHLAKATFLPLPFVYQVVYQKLKIIMGWGGPLHQGAVAVPGPHLCSGQLYVIVGTVTYLLHYML